MKITSADLSQEGRLLKFRFHDGHIVAFSYRYDEDFVFEVQRADGSIAACSLSKVTSFGCCGFQKGTIISDVYVWRKDRTPASHSSDPEGAWAVLFGKEVPVSMLLSSIEPIVEREQPSYLVFIESSYGGSVALLCDEVEVNELGHGVRG